LICRHKQGQGIFVASTLGPHTCLGAGVAEVQLMVTVGAWLRAVGLELETPKHEIKTKLMPIPSPDPKFKLAWWRIAKFDRKGRYGSTAMSFIL
jgi:cytochrome P450